VHRSVTDLQAHPLAALHRLALLTVIASILSGCATLNVGSDRGVSSTVNFVGRLTTSVVSAAVPQTPLVAFVTVAQPDGSLDLRAYMCDGTTGGEVLWARGPVAAGEIGQPRAFALVSPAGYEIEGTVSALAVEGTIIGDGAGSDDALARSFSAPRAPEGSGIYDLVVDGAGNLAGTGLTGEVLTLAKSSEPVLSVGDGLPFTGTLTAGGTTIDFIQMDLSTVDPGLLTAEGFPAEFGEGTAGVEPGTFRAIMLLDDGVYTSFGRLLLPGTGVTGVPPRFGLTRVVFSCRFCRMRL
jgi:hypothetical protein